MPSGRRLRLSNEARGDIRDIRRYTAQVWGTQQRDRYFGQLNDALQSLLDYPERGRARDEFFVGCRSLPVGQHVIFYHLIESGVRIVRVLHANQDAYSKIHL